MLLRLVAEAGECEDSAKSALYSFTHPNRHGFVYLRYSRMSRPLRRSIT
jgi:hypothetical protein